MKSEGCDRIFHGKVSGAAKHRPEFERMQEQLRPGDGVVVYDIDSLGRTTVELILLVDAWNERNIGLKSASKPLIDTTTEHGGLLFKLFAVLAEHERKRLVRRTKARLDAARAQCKLISRPCLAGAKQKAIYELFEQGVSMNQVSKRLGIPYETAYNYVKKRKSGKELSIWALTV